MFIYMCFSNAWVLNISWDIVCWCVTHNHAYCYYQGGYSFTCTYRSCITAVQILSCFVNFHLYSQLCQGGHFSGIYRKVQLKPLKWVKVAKGNGEGEEERPVEALMVLKYGGVLTHAGRKQVLINRNTKQLLLSLNFTRLLEFHFC